MGSIYSIKAPTVNAVLPPLTLQTLVATSISRPGIFEPARLRGNGGLDLIGLGKGIDPAGRKVGKRSAHCLMNYPAL